MVWRGAQDDGSSEDDQTPGPTITCYQQHIPCQDSVPYHREVWVLAKKLAAPAAPLTQPHQADKKSLHPRDPPTSPRHRSPQQKVLSSADNNKNIHHTPAPPSMPASS
jgi:hypothetical protein